MYAWFIRTGFEKLELRVGGCLSPRGQAPGFPGTGRAGPALYPSPDSTWTNTTY
ncbi:hypothetical protein [Bordetella pertussis]|uniref:hypothetical protein n=1 Tax=Bordetella pertussis TaxID=520 RepID=UPI00190F799A|nr:hypothetical protein [Bordetella pertussis]